MIAIRGADSQIAIALMRMLPTGEVAVRVPRGGHIPTCAERYLFCQGYLKGTKLSDQIDTEIAEAFLANTTRVIEACDGLIANNDHARICVVGSESGFAWSYDAAYAAAKAGLHRYVETKRLRTPDQQLICVAPSIIEDADMTLRRTDHQNVAVRRITHPKGRFLDSEEVARLIHFLLYVDRGYLSGVVIRMNGGSHTV